MTTKNDPALVARLARAAALPCAMAREFCEEVFGSKFEAAPHIRYIERRVLPLMGDDSQRSYLMVNAPPRHGKSFYVAWLVAWYLLTNPTKRVIYVTYSDELSRLAGDTVKAIIDKLGPYFGVKVPKNASSVNFNINGNPLSGLLAVGVGSGITGRGGDLVIIDDLIKNSVEANSQAVKKMHVTEYDSTISTRIQAGGTLMMIATRWADDDLPGTIKERCGQEGYDGDPWQFVSFPALAEVPEEELESLAESFTDEELERVLEEWRDELGRKEGEALWPKVISQMELERRRSSIDPAVWACLFQQRTSVKGGGMFPIEAWKYYPPDEPPDVVARCWVWDLAFTEDDGDWSVGLLMGITSDRKLVLLKRLRFQGHGGTVETEVLGAAYASGTGVPLLIEQERAGSGKFVVNHFTRKLEGWIVRGVRPEGQKEERAGPLSSIVRLGGFLLPQAAPWLKEWHQEFRKFPKVRHDDQVDAAVHGAEHLMGTSESSLYVPSGLEMDGGERMMRRFLEQAGIYSIT